MTSFNSLMARLAVFLTLFVPQCLCNSEPSIISKLVSSEFTGFVNMLEHAGIIDEIEAKAKEPEGVTILPVTDNYLVNKVSPVLLSWLTKDNNVPALRRVLMNHVIVGQHQHHQLDGQKTILGKKVKITSINGQRMVEDIPIKKANAIKASNGVAHSVEGLMVPEDIKAELSSFLNELSDFRDRKSVRFNRFESMKLEATTPTTAPSPSPSSAPAPSPSGISELISKLSENGDFDSLLSLISTLGLTDALDAQLQNPTTILAPVDSAFANANKTVIDHLNTTNLLADVIKYHIITDYFTEDTLVNSSSTNTSSKAESECTVRQYATLNADYKMDVLVCANNSVYYGPQRVLATGGSLIENGELSASGINEIIVPLEYLPKSLGMFNIAGVVPFLTAIFSVVIMFAM